MCHSVKMLICLFFKKVAECLHATSKRISVNFSALLKMLELILNKFCVDTFDECHLLCV